MITRTAIVSAARSLPSISRPWLASSTRISASRSDSARSRHAPTRSFTASLPRLAQGPTANAVMETLNDLYATAKDEFEIAAEETEKQTVYAEDDRAACKEAFDALQGAFDKALKECSPEVAKEVQSRTGPRLRELENAIKAMEEMAQEH